ncbi:MAG TPA: hypothetical protein VF037_04690 [Gemmatimonadales bacterium]
MTAISGSAPVLPTVQPPRLEAMPSTAVTTFVPAATLRAALPGLALATCAILFGFLMGGLFGLNEAAIKDRLATSAAAVTATVYQGDAAKAEPVIAKSWEYMQRAHLHGGAIGTAALGLIGVLLVIGASPRRIRILGVALGLGALGYSVFWMWAGFIAPGLGSTGAAKESLRWLAMPSAGALMLGTVAVAVLTVRAMFAGDRSTT